MEALVIMKKSKRMLLITAMLLGCLAQAFAGNVNLGGWESTNHDDGSTDSHTVTFTGTKLQFNWFVDSEENYDKLIVKLNGVTIVEASGSQLSGTYTNENLSSSTHTLEFFYTKDGSSNSGTDQAIITDIIVYSLETFSQDGLEYLSENDNSLIVTSCSLSEGNLTIPSTVTFKGVTYNVVAIGDGAFRNCTNLSSITLPASITRIGNNAFAGCTGKLTVNCNIPDASNGIGVFNGSNFTKVIVGQSVESIGTYAFYNMSSLQEVVLPENLKHIGAYAFASCSSLKMTLPASIETIGNYAFQNSTISFSATDPNWFTNNAESSAFSNANAIIVPDDAYDAYIASANWTKYGSNIHRESEMHRYEYIDDNGVTWKYRYVYATNSLSIISATGYTTSLVFPETLPCGEDSLSIGGVEFGIYDNANITSIDLSATSIKNIEHVMYGGDYVEDYVEGVSTIYFSNCPSLQSVFFPSSLENIGFRAFYNCPSLKTINWSELTSLRTIGAEAFAQYSEDYCPITNIDLSATKVETIGNSAFKNMRALNNIKFPATLKSIGEYAFYYCHNLDSLDLSNTQVAELGTQSFWYCNNLRSVSLPASLKKIGSYAFYNCHLYSINLSNVETIGDNAFESCNLYDIDLSSAKTIGSKAFTHNATVTIDSSTPAAITANSFTQDTRFIVPSNAYDDFCTASIWRNWANNISMYNVGDDDVKWIYRYLSGTNSMSITSASGYGKNLVIPSFFSHNGSDVPVTQLECSFSGDSIMSVTLPSNLKSIPSYAFENCYSLSTIDIPNTVTKIGTRAFAETKIRVMTIPESVDTISGGAFPSSMRKLVCEGPTPPELSDLGNIFIVYVPMGCRNNYISVYPWSSNRVIVDGSGVTVNVNATPGMMGEEILKHTSYLADVNFLILSGKVDNTDIDNLKNSMPNLLTIDMHDLDLETIPSSLFENRRALLEVILPKNAKTIGNGAFANCINLDSIALPEGLLRLEDGYYDNYSSNNNLGCFENCNTLVSVTFPSTLTDIGECAFKGCSSLRTITMGDGLVKIGEGAFANCYSLENVVLGLNTESIGREAFINCSRLNNVEFNSNLKRIENRAFAYNNSLRNLNFPQSLESISAGAFYSCNGLETIIFADGVSSIGYEYESNNDDYYDSYSSDYIGAFQHCYNLKQVKLPKSLRNIYQYTFSGCSNLTQITIPEGVTYIGKDAFSGCSSLVKVDLPSTLLRCSKSPFKNCSKLAEVNCMSLIPPTLADGLLTLDDMGMAIRRILNVPEWTVNRYKLTSGWAAFSQILPIPDVYPNSINIVGNAVLVMPDSLLPANYKPDMNITSYRDYSYEYAYDHYNASSLHLRGKGTLSLDNFNLQHGVDMGGGMAYSQLLNDATMTADSVRVAMSLSNYNYDGNRSQWYFLSFPFDVKISDIATNSDWVVRRYDSKARANGNYSSTWVTVPYNGTLYAGQGYIWSSSGGNFTIPAVDNAKKNNIFANTTRTIALQKYPAEFLANSGWNLIGNPFPCYYDSRYMDFTAPITVWDMYNNTYSAYSPVDDDYVFKPFEAFFVQCPSSVDSIAFDPAGRQLTAVASSANNARMQSDNSERMVFNLLLSNDQFTDRTRIVLNDAAKMDYETICDAAKFMSTNGATPQLYTIYNNEKYAINERPISNGVVGLGMYAGSAGSYTISLKDVCEQTVILVDLNTGTQTDLTKESYTFDTEVGENNNFEVRIYTDMEATAIEDIDASKLAEITANNGVIAIDNRQDAKVTIYNVAGQLIASKYGKSMRIDVEPGLYIVEINGKSQKVHVVK